MPKPVEVIIFETEPPCTVCVRAAKVATKVKDEYFGDKVRIRRVSCLTEEAKEWDVQLAPTIVVGEYIIAEGEVPHKEEFVAAIQQALGE
ncbi:MAG: thioredoxin family protein [Promethearchaeota archaeon]